MSLERKMNRELARKAGTGGVRRSPPGKIGRNVRIIWKLDSSHYHPHTYHNRKGWR